MRGKSDKRSFWASVGKEQNMRHNRVVRSFQARTLSLEKRPRASMDFIHVACRRVRARRQQFRRARTAARLRTPRGNTLPWKIVRPECGRRPIQKARDQFPGAGFVILAMMTICG